MQIRSPVCRHEFYRDHFNLPVRLFSDEIWGLNSCGVALRTVLVCFSHSSPIRTVFDVIKLNVLKFYKK